MVGRKIIALRYVPGSKVSWSETHIVKHVGGMLPPTNFAPQGAIEFTAVEGGTRTLGVHEIVEII